MIFPKPHSIELTNDTIKFSSLNVCDFNEKLIAEFSNIFNVKTASNGLKVNKVIDLSLTKTEEYEIKIDKEVSILGATEEAIIRGLISLFQLVDKCEDAYSLKKGVVRDYAYMSIRGIHIYLPPVDCIDECKRFILASARLKYNTVFLEIGAGMEYESHPEVNIAWVKFCRDVNRYPDGPWGLQASEAYWKDSTHIELAGGNFLKKSEVKDLCDYIKMLGMEVIPEIQGLSHAYYLTLADRSIAERPFEPYPDSYCPSNEKSYQLYEDLAKEIIEVIQPKRVSIGHDEIRVIGECPLCKDKSGAELLAYDINRLHAIYKKYGIQIFMWGEKLQNIKDYRGNQTGGNELKERIDKFGRKYALKATHGAIDLIEKDVTMLDWYYSQSFDTEGEFNAKGFNEIFGNFAGSKIVKWDKRSKSPNLLGAEVSTWCIPNEYELGYNGWIFELVFSADVMWRSDYNDEIRYDLSVQSEKLLPHIRSIMQNDHNVFTGKDSELKAVLLDKTQPSQQVELVNQIQVEDSLAEKIAGDGIFEQEAIFVNDTADKLVFFHATEKAPENRIQTWAFKDKGTEICGYYAIQYEDGIAITLPIEFPVMIGALKSSIETFIPNAESINRADIDDDREATELSECPLVSACDVYRDATSYFCNIINLKKEDESLAIYGYQWNNPRKDVKISKVIRFESSLSPLKLKLYGLGLK